MQKILLIAHPVDGDTLVSGICGGSALYHEVLTASYARMFCGIKPAPN